MGYGTYKDFPGEPLVKRPFWIRGMPQAFDDLPGPQGSISLAVVVDDIDCADAVVYAGTPPPPMLPFSKLNPE